MNYSGVRGQRRTVKDKKSRSIPESTNVKTSHSAQQPKQKTNLSC